jgi:F0F1-type ATP synthase delta subunit
MQISRRTCLTVFAASIAASPALTGKENDRVREFLEASQNDKKSVMLHVKGQSIGGIVVKIAGDVVELKNREYSRIVVRLDSIDAAMMM